MFMHFSVQTKCWVQKLLREQGEAGEGQEDHTHGGHHGKGLPRGVRFSNLAH